MDSQCRLGDLGQIISPLYDLRVLSFKMGKIIVSDRVYFSPFLSIFLSSEIYIPGTVFRAFHVETHLSWPIALCVESENAWEVLVMMPNAKNTPCMLAIVHFH